MNRVSVLVACVTLAAGLPAAAQVQQLPDSTFVPQVAAPAFISRHPKILFDEAHHNFHTLSGRYQAFGKLMAADGCVLTANQQPFSAATLQGYDVLVIANARGAERVAERGADPGVGASPAAGNDSTALQSAFTPEEIAAVHEWVRQGGALLLIADHAPFGSAAAALSARFGVDMSQGYTADSLQAAGSGSATNIAFTRERGTLGDHPIMNGRNDKERIHKVVAFTGQSLLGPKDSTPLMLLSDAAFDLPLAVLKLRDDPAAMLAKSVPAKGRAMAVAMQVGKGRAVIQAEAAMLSAQLIVRPGQETYKFGMNQPDLDNLQFALNEMRWLARAK